MAMKSTTRKPAKPHQPKDLPGKDVKGGGIPLI